MTLKQIHPTWLLCIACASLSITNTSQGQCATQTAKVVAFDGLAHQLFGRSAAISNDVVMIAKPATVHGIGAVYSFRRTGDSWEFEQKLESTDGGLNDSYGRSVAVDGDMAIVGAPFVDRSGAAYIFRFNGSMWIEEAKLNPSDGFGTDYFGLSVAISGQTVVIGASHEPRLGPGKAYVFGIVDDVWVEQAILIGSDTEPKDYFGKSVAIDGDTIVVGAWNESNNNLSFPDGMGAAYVFTRDPGNGAWTEQAKLISTDPLPFEQDRFGRAVAIAQGRIVVGTEPVSTSVNPGGSAYVFHFDGTQWQSEAKLVGSDTGGANRFGMSVAFDGRTIVIGAWGQRDRHCPFGETCLDGAAYVFTLDSDQVEWIEQTKLISDDREANDHLGWAVAVDGLNAVVGAFYDDDMGTNSGSAYIFDITDCLPCRADFNGDGRLDTLDFLEFLNAFSANDPRADFDGNGQVNTLDFLAFLNAFNEGCE